MCKSGRNTSTEPPKMDDRKMTKTQKYKELHSLANSFWDDFDSGAKSAKKTAMRLRFRLRPC